MTTSNTAMPEVGEVVDDTKLNDCNFIDRHSYPADRWKYQHPFDFNAHGNSPQEDCWTMLSFHEVIQSAPNDKESIVELRGGGGGGSTATTTDDQQSQAEDCEDDHSELVNFLESNAAGFNFAEDTTVAANADDDQISDACFDYSELFNCLEDSASALNLNTNKTATTKDDLKSKDQCVSDAEMVNYLEGSGLLDDDPDSRLFEQYGSTTPQFSEGKGEGGGALSLSHHLREYTLRQWIMCSKCTEIDSSTNKKITLGALQPSGVSNKYIRSALQIALKLTEFILEAERDERMGFRNPVPLASIAPENVLIRARRNGNREYREGGADTDEREEQDETINFVWVMSFVGDDLATTGTVMSRLFALGKVLYELFSTNDEPMWQEQDRISACQNGNIVSMSSMNLRGYDEDSSNDRPPKRSQRRSAHSTDDNISNLVSRLESMGIPWSLCFLMKNLLDCQHDSFSEDDAYTSFTDLQLDLKLMVENPSCFLDDIISGSSVPKFANDDKLYGRDDEMKKIEELYQQHIKGKNDKINGIIISGAAGVGKSSLAKYLQILSNQSCGYFLSAKFEQNQMSLKPLSTLVNMFNSLCDMIFDDSSQTQLMRMEGELTSAIGSDSHLLGILPSLGKLMPSSVLLDSSTSDCVDSAISMRYLFAVLLHVISSHSKPITLLLDDVQYADHASLLVAANLLFSPQETSVFFVICHRDDETSLSGPFHTWLKTISILSLAAIHLKPISPEGSNNLISETFHLSPRITRPLSSVLYHKTMGNPLFLRQLLISLTEQGYIYVDIIRHRWTWDLDKIMELEISDSVLALLMKEIERLPDDMKFGLQVASCIGSHMTESLLANLSTELGLDLIDILRQLSQKGFIIDIAGATMMFRFAHDKIQQAAYELIPDHERRANHMRFGLALCYHTLNNGVTDEELFFAAVNQINQGGPSAVQEPRQKSVLAELNLKAGRRSIDLSDYNTAFTMFQYGLSFLGEDSWSSNYALSLDLHDSLTEVAMILNKPTVVEFYSGKVISNAICFDDKLNCLCTSVQALGAALCMDKSIEVAFGILLQFGEELPRDMGDDEQQTNIDKMTYILHSTSDDAIYNMQENKDKKLTALFMLYVYLGNMLYYFKPSLFGSVSLRMMEITMNNGLSASPLAFAHFGSLAVTIGYVTVGCRLGKTALKLLERKGSLQYKSKVINDVYSGIFFLSEPLQSIVDSHLQGYKAGQLSGDLFYGLKNVLLAIVVNYVAGQNLDIVEKKIVEFVSNLQRHGVKLYLRLTLIHLSQIMVLKEGLHVSRTSHLENMPNEVEILADASTPLKIIEYGKLHRLTRAFLFRQMDDSSLQNYISVAVAKKYLLLDPMILLGYFFEGLASFLLARRSMMNRSCNDELSSSKLMEHGQSILKRMRCWSEHSSWNWEDKMLLLNAENLFTLGDYEQASFMYDNAIQSAHDHKFIHEEAIASELAGIFYHERGMHCKSYPYFVHSVRSYKEWGAHAVAERVDTFLRDVVVTNAASAAAATGDTVDVAGQEQLLSTIADSNSEPLGHLFVSASSSEDGKKKRREIGEH